MAKIQNNNINKDVLADYPKYKIAVVEDEDVSREKVCSYISQYGIENKIDFEIQSYSDGLEIVNDTSNKFDIIFFDIEMKHLNGMDAAKKLRALDDTVVIIFITNMAQYAIEGYEVSALAYVLKPINYSSFSFRLSQAIEHVHKRETIEILLRTPEGIRKINSKDIYYVEIVNRILHFHTTSGEYTQRGTMQSAEALLRDYHFYKCNH